MLSTIKQEVIIPPNGIITIHSPELKPGLRAEVIVYLKDLSLPSQAETFPNENTETLRELLDNVAKERMTLTYQKKVFLAAVPIEDAAENPRPYGFCVLCCRVTFC